jgi:hypothetical protein
MPTIPSAPLCLCGKIDCTTAARRHGGFFASPFLNSLRAFRVFVVQQPLAL